MIKTAKKTPRGISFTELILETFRLNGLLLNAGDTLTADLGLSSALWQVLGAIDEEPLHMAQIARNMGLARQSVRRTAYVLEKKGLVFFTDNPDHKRAKLVSLTEKGREILDRLNIIQIEWSNEVAKDLHIDDLSSAVQLLKELNEKLQTPSKG